MTVYSPYYDEFEDIWYVNVMTPKGVKKMIILNPLYYFHMMNVEPPVGANFSEQIIDDYDELLEESNLEKEYSTLEPYQNLSDQSPSHKLGLFKKKSVAQPFIYMSLNGHSSMKQSSQKIIPLNLSDVQVNTTSLENSSNETPVELNENEPVNDSSAEDPQFDPKVFLKQIDVIKNFNKAFVNYLELNAVANLLHDDSSTTNQSTAGTSEEDNTLSPSIFTSNIIWPKIESFASKFVE